MSGGDVLSSKLFERSELLAGSTGRWRRAEAAEARSGPKRRRVTSTSGGVSAAVAAREEGHPGTARSRHHMRRIGAELTRASETNVGPGRNVGERPSGPGQARSRPGRGSRCGRSACGPSVCGPSVCFAGGCRPCSSDSMRMTLGSPAARPVRRCRSPRCARPVKSCPMRLSPMRARRAGSGLVPCRLARQTGRGRRRRVREQRGLESAGERGVNGAEAQRVRREIVECF